MDKGISWGCQAQNRQISWCLVQGLTQKLWMAKACPAFSRETGGHRTCFLSPGWSQERNPQRVTQHPESPGAAGSPQITNSLRQEGLQRKLHHL